jgi:hypothetical protein
VSNCLQSDGKHGREHGMPFNLNWEPHGVVVGYYGTVTTREVMMCHEEIAATPGFDDLRFAIVDTLLVTAVVIGDSDIPLINAFLRGPSLTNPNIGVVFVATHPDVLRVLSLYDAVYPRAYQQTVSCSAEAARELIERSKPDFRPKASITR